MKSKAKVLTIISILLMLSVLFVASCSESGITKPEVSEKLSMTTQEINFLQWNTDAVTVINSLGKTDVSQKIFTQTGGELATAAMMGCKLIVPANAFNDTERLIQASVTSEGDNFAGIEFLPSQQFTKNVTIQLPLSAIRLESGVDVNDIRAFWYNEETQQWVEIQDVDIDDENQLVSTKINHFTRFGWGI